MATVNSTWQIAPAPLAVGVQPTTPSLCLAHVRDTAAELLAELERAANHSRRWTDQDLGYALVDAALSRCLQRLEQTGLWGRDNQIASSELWRVAGDVLQCGWLQWRARSKPNGYAGDHALMDRMWRDECCNDPLGRLFDRYFQSQAAVQAVRSRIRQAAVAIVSRCMASQEESYRVASVGAGPSIDIQLAVRWLPSEHRRRLHVTLLDLDPEALNSAQARLREFLTPDQIVCVRENLFRLADRKSTNQASDSQDFIVCSGLFDYLEPAPASALLRMLWNRLNRGGTMMVGNFAPHCPSRSYMEWIGNWYLLYRTPDELRALAAAGIPSDCVRVDAERLGIDLFLSVAK